MTEDVGPQGCRVPAPGSHPAGERLRVLLAGPQSERPLVIEGRTVWCSAHQPWRLGVAFSGADAVAVTHWFDELAAGHLELMAEQDLVPDEVPPDAQLHVGRVVTASELDGVEAEVIRLATRSATVAELTQQLGQEWSQAKRTLFSLMARGILTVGPAAAAAQAAPPSPVTGGAVSVSVVAGRGARSKPRS